MLPFLRCEYLQFFTIPIPTQMAVIGLAKPVGPHSCQQYVSIIQYFHCNMKYLSRFVAIVGLPFVILTLSSRRYRSLSLGILFVILESLSISGATSYLFLCIVHFLKYFGGCFYLQSHCVYISDAALFFCLENVQTVFLRYQYLFCLFSYHKTNFSTQYL